MQVRAWLATVVLLIAGVPSTLFAQSDELHTLNHQVKQLYEAGKYSEAIPLAEKSLELTRAQEGEGSAQTAVRTSWLATLYQGQGRYADAEPLLSAPSRSVRRCSVPTTPMSARRSITSPPVPRPRSLRRC